MPVRITRYSQAFQLIDMEFTPKAKSVIAMLERQGHSEKSICFAIWKEQNKLLKLQRDERFWGAFVNCVRHWSWPKGDPRWDDYWRRKKEEKKAAEEEARMAAYKKRYPGFVYFIQGESGGAIKIGYTQDVKARLKSLQTGHPDVLVLLACFPGNQSDERDLHEKFDAFRLRGEWFKPSEFVLREVESKKEKYKRLNSQNIPMWPKD